MRTPGPWWICFSAPPSSILSDAATLSRFADQGIFVVRQDYAPVDRIREGIDILSDSGLQVAGCLMNYTQASVADYAYGYGYGYGSGRYGSKYGRYGGGRYGGSYGNGGYGRRSRKLERQEAKEQREEARAAEQEAKAEENNKIEEGV